MTTTTPALFVGWLRVGRSPWRPVVSGADERTVERQLFAASRQHRIVDLVLLPEGTDPNTPPPRRKPR